MQAYKKTVRPYLQTQFAHCRKERGWEGLLFVLQSLYTAAEKT